MSDRWLPFLVFTSIAWAALAALSFLAGHPFMEFFPLRELGICALFVLAALGIGRILLDAALDLWPGDFLLGWMSALALGLLGLGLCGMLLGLLNLFHPVPVWMLLLLLLGLSWRGWTAFFSDLKDFLSSFPGLRPVEALLSACLGLWGLWIYARALVPSGFYDTMVLNLGLPFRHAAFHGMSAFPYNYHTFGPQYFEMLVTQMLVAGGGAATPQFLNALLAVCGAAAVFLLARLWTEERVWALAAALVYACTPVVTHMGGILKNDSAIALASMLALLWTVRSWEEASEDEEPRMLFVAGLCAGWAAGIKFSGAFLAASLAPLVAARALAEWKQAGKTLLLAAAFAGTALLAASPWYLRNWALTGNPVYPAGASIFGMPDFAGDAYAKDVRKISGTSEFLALPWNLTMQPQASFGHLGGIGFLYLALLPLIFLMRGRPESLNWLLAWAGLFFLFWAWSFTLPRLLMPLLALLAAAGTWAMERGAEAWRPSRFFWPALLAAGCLAGLLHAAIFEHILVEPATWLFGSAAQRERWEREFISTLAVFEFANENLDPSRHRILLVGETRQAWLRVPHEAASAYDRMPLADWAAQFPSRDELLQHLRSMGYTHFIVNFSEMQRLGESYGTPVPASLPAPVKELLASCSKIFSANGLDLLALPDF
jgi:hypothetical protein